MKRFSIFVTTIILLGAAALQSCIKNGDNISPIETAEVAYANGNYVDAQELCNDLSGDETTARMSVEELCRLSLLLVHLSEVNGEDDDNAATAARLMETAINRSADSTAIFLANAPVEDRAALALISAINDGINNPVDTDSIDFPEAYAE